MLLAALLLAQVTQGAPSVPLASPTASPLPGAPRRSAIVDIDAGGSNSYLNNGKGRWETGYFNAAYQAPSGFKVHFDALNEVRFGSSTDVYGGGVEVPTGHPNGTVHVGYAVSSKNDVIPSSAILAGYDLRGGGGWSYQFGYAGRDFAAASAANYGFGVEKHFDRQALGYFVNFSTVSNKTGLGIVQGLRWANFLPADTVTFTADAGRGAESTGRARVRDPRRGGLRRRRAPLARPAYRPPFQRGLLLGGPSIPALPRPDGTKGANRPPVGKISYQAKGWPGFGR